MTIQEMREKRAALWDAAKIFMDAHSANGAMSGEDMAQYDRMVADVDNMTHTIERMEKASMMDDSMSMPTSQPIRNKLIETVEKHGVASDEYRNACINAIKSKFMQVSNVMQEGVASDGGYLVPDEWDKRLIDTLNEENVMRKLGTVIKTAGTHKIPLVASKPAAAWVAENGALTFGGETFGQKVLDAYKLHVGVKISEELLYDNAYNIESHLVNAFADALANAEEDAFLNGTLQSGESEMSRPTGVLTNATHAVTGKSAVAADDIITLVYALKRPYRKNAAFIMNDATIAAVRKLKDTTNNYLWQPSMIAGEPDRLLGYPVYTSAYMPKIADGKDFIAFGDFKYYNIGDRGPRSFTVLNELFAANGQVAYVAKERVDGKLLVAEAVQTITGAAS